MEYVIGIIIVLALTLVLFVILSTRTAGVSSHDRKMVQKKWKEIEKEKDIKKAIMEADKLIDFVLKELRYTGTLGEKMKKAKNLFTNNNQLWTAHKLRNRIAHELHVEVSEKEGKTALNYFKKALHNLGIKL